MSKTQLTEEQQKVILHPMGQHARVLAVAGSGKTTTMVHRIDHLVTKESVPPSNIFVLMFNRLARLQFKEKLTQIGLPLPRQPQVHSFHSFAYMVVNEAVKSKLIPAFKNIWIEDKSELVRYAIHRAIDNLERQNLVKPDSIDPDVAIEAIGLWKGSLIPPERAGYHDKMDVPRVYEEFERLRIKEHALTFDDFVPLAVGILETEEAIAKLWCNRAASIIVDEYQDVNHGQQRLIELLAGRKADVMVVGDDDQTIYEWRGARPSYILKEFVEVFSNKPHVLYQLPHSFRFGPVIAQCAQNVIEYNTNRIEKPLIAHAMSKGADITVFMATTWQQTDPHLSLTTQVKTLVRETNDPSNIIVLGRTYAQLCELEAMFLGQKIPYRVLGNRPFFERREIQVLLDYVRLAQKLEQPVSGLTQKLLLSVANTPNRKLSREILARAVSTAHQREESSSQALRFLTDSPRTPLSKGQREQAEDLLHKLDRIHERLQSKVPAGEFLEWLVDMLDYLKHFEDYYGLGENSEDRKQSVLAFCNYAIKTNMCIQDLVTLVGKLDTTQGAPMEHQIVMTTVFRTKGLEYDYVVIPNCVERCMPCLFGQDNLTYDKAGLVKEPPPSDMIDNERRLFYVAVTRARKAVYIGTTNIAGKSTAGKSPQISSRFLDEMALQPTVEIMNAVQGCAAGEAKAQGDLVESISKHGAIKNILSNLVTHYFKDNTFKALAEKIRKLANRTPRKEVQYSAAYSDSHRQNTPVVLPFEEKPWWN